MNRQHRRMLAACRFRTVFLPVAGAVRGREGEIFLWTEPTPAPPCDVECVADAIRTATDAGRAFYLFFKHREPRDAMKRALLAAGINARREVLQ